MNPAAPPRAVNTYLKKGCPMSFLQAVLEGVLQGATEFLPVSSSGHLSLSQHFLGMQPGGGKNALYFDVMLHLGTLAAVLAVYYRLVGRLIREAVFVVRDLCTGRFRWKGINSCRRLLFMLILGMVPLFLLFLPVPGTGMALKDFASRWAEDSGIVVEGGSLIATGILLALGIRASRRTEKRGVRPGGRPNPGRKEYTAGDALTVGLFQCAAAVFPGLSRSGSTLSAGLMRGISRRAALDYSFVVGIPPIVAAAVMEAGEVQVRPAGPDLAAMLAGMAAAAVVGFLAIQLVRRLCAASHLGVFVVYTLILGSVVLVLGILEHHTGVNAVTGARLNF